MDSPKRRTVQRHSKPIHLHAYPHMHERIGDAREIYTCAEKINTSDKHTHTHRSLLAVLGEYGAAIYNEAVGRHFVVEFQTLLRRCDR